MERSREDELESSVAFLESVIQDYDCRLAEIKTIWEAKQSLLESENKALKRQVADAKILAETVVEAMGILKRMNL